MGILLLRCSRYNYSTCLSSDYLRNPCHSIYSTRYILRYSPSFRPVEVRGATPAMSVKFEKEQISTTPVVRGGKHESIPHRIGERLTGGPQPTGYLAAYLKQLKNPQDGCLWRINQCSDGPYPHRLPTMGLCRPNQLESEDPANFGQQLGDRTHPEYRLSSLDGCHCRCPHMASSPCHCPCWFHACHESQLDHISFGFGLCTEISPRTYLGTIL